MITTYQVIKTFSALLFICAVAAFILRRWGHLLQDKELYTSKNKNNVRAIESVQLGDTHSLHFVTLNSQVLLISTTPTATVVHGEIVSGELKPFATSSAIEKVSPKKLSIVGKR